MGNEMGNNNTSTIKEEDNISEAEKKALQEDTSELANGMSQEIHEDSAKEEIQNVPTSIAKDVMEKVSEASIGITNELGKETWQEEDHAEDVKGKTQTIIIAEAKDADTREKAMGTASNHTTSMLENDSMEGDTHASDLNMKNQMLLTAEAEEVQEKDVGLVSEDATTELGKVTLQEDSHQDYEKEKSQMIPTEEAKDVLDSNSTTSMLENDLLGEDTCKSVMNMENKMHSIAEVEDVQEKATGMASDYTRSSLENDLLKGDASEDNVHVDDQKHQTVEGKVDEKQIAARLDFDDKTSTLEVKPQEDKKDGNVVPIAHDIDVQGITINSASDDSLKNSFEGSVEAKGGKFESLSSSSMEGTEEYEKQDETCSRKYLLETYNHHLNNGPAIQQGDEITDVRQSEKSPNDGSVEAKGGNSESLSRSSLEDNEKHEKQEETCLREHLLDNHQLNSELAIQQGVEITEVRQPEKSPNDGSVEAEGGNSESLSSSSLEGTEECEKQEETCLREHRLVTYNNHLNNEPSIQDGNETIEVRQPEKSPNNGSVESEGGNSESLSSSSLEGTEEYEKQKESCLREHLLVAYNHHFNNEPSIQQDEEETMVLTLDAVNVSNNMEIQESSSGHSDHDERDKFLSDKSFLGTESLLEVNLLDTNSHSEHIKDDGSEKEMESHEKLCTDKSDGKDGNEFGSSFIDTSGTPPNIDSNTNGDSLTEVNCITVDNPPKFDHEENCKVLYGESILSRSGSTMENSHDYKPDQCMKDSLKEYKSGLAYTCDMAIGSNGERKMLLDSNVSRLATNDQVEEPKVSENGVPFDAYVNNSNNASEESGAVSDQKHSLIAGLTVVDCKYEEGESYKNKIEETYEKSEASHVMLNTFEGTEMSEQCNSDLVTINPEESFPLQNNSSLLHIYDGHHDNVKQDESYTKLTVPSVDLVDDEAFEKDGEGHPQHAEVDSFAGAELTISTATMSIEPCSNNFIFANGVYETRDSVTRLSTESNPDNPISSQMQRSPSFNLNLRKQRRPEESDRIPLLQQDKSANKSLPKQTSQNLIIKSMPHDDYEEMPVEEKIVTMERSYSKKSKAPFIGLLKEEEEAHLLDMALAQDNHVVGTKNAVSSTLPKRKEKRKPRSSFFSSCMCCATVP